MTLAEALADLVDRLPIHHTKAELAEQATHHERLPPMQLDQYDDDQDIDDRVEATAARLRAQGVGQHPNTHTSIPDPLSARQAAALMRDFRDPGYLPEEPEWEVDR